MLAELETHPEGLSYAELEALLGKKKRTIAADVEELRTSGSHIKIKNNKLYLQNKGRVISHSNKQTVRRIALLIQADQEALTKQMIVHRKCTKLFAKKTNAALSNKRVDMRDKTKAADVKALCDAGMLYENREKYLLDWNAPKNVYFKDYEFEIIYQAIKENSEGYVYRKTLRDVADQVQDAMQYKLLYDEQDFVSSNTIIEKKQISDTVMDHLITMFRNIDFRKHVLRVAYRLSEDQIVQREIAVGMFIYSIDHAKVYLLGKEYAADCYEENTILDVQKIEHVTACEQKHAYYLSSEFFGIYNEMYSVSIEPCQDVEVIFDDVFNIREKIERLADSRVYASISVQDGKIFYTDKIRGINDFAKYLRGFGMSCKVIKPDNLVEKLYHSACRIYELYQNEEDDENGLNNK